MSAAGQLRSEHAARVRASAAIDAVWAEVGSLSLAMGHGPGIVEFHPTDEGRKASFAADLSWGPVHWNVRGQAEEVVSEPPNRFSWRAEVPRFPVHVTGDIELVRVSDTETNLDYRFVVSMPRRTSLHERMFKVFSAILADHVEEFAARIAALAAQHAKAEQQLGGKASRAT